MILIVCTRTAAGDARQFQRVRNQLRNEKAAVPLFFGNPERGDGALESVGHARGLLGQGGIAHETLHGSPFARLFVRENFPSRDVLDRLHSAHAHGR